MLKTEHPNSRPGMNFIGMECVDINECELNTHTCVQPMSCINVEVTNS